jgi:hypothetical protein
MGRGRGRRRSRCGGVALAVEDRCTPVLSLELADVGPEEAAARARELVSHRGAERVTWWENCMPGRSDLPMKVHDGRSLVVVEAAEGFVAPAAAPQALAAHTFARYPRPSQGILSGQPTLGLMVVWISPRSPDMARQLRDWGDFVHIRHIAAAGIPGFTQISVYENVEEIDPLYMHFYEFDDADAEGTFSKMIEHVAPRLGDQHSDAYKDWADLRAPGGRLFYCNTFRRLGAIDAAEEVGTGPVL